MAPQSSLSLAVPLLLFAIFTVTPAEEGIIQRSKRRIQCGEFLICSEENRKPFEKRRKMAQSLVHFHKQIKWSGYVDQ
uniref:Uncharacterized protein n=1 Tax=Steinernema glaseri TaxID=37863 RepID=A0A1I7ZGP0_9BILA